MVLDIRTVVTILGMIQVLQVLVFYYQFSANRSVNGPGWWLLWSIAETVGFFLLLLRNIPSFIFLGKLTMDLVMLLGAVFVYIGVMKFFGKKVQFKLLIVLVGLFLFIHLFFLFVIDCIEIRSIIFAVSVSVISFITAFSFIRYKTPPVKLTANYNTVLFVIHGLVFAYRAVKVATGTSVTDIYSSSFFNLLPYVDTLIVSLLWTMGFIIMLNQKLTAEISETKSQFEIIFNSSPDAALISRLDDGMIVEFNESFSNITRYSRKELEGKTVSQMSLWKNQEDRSEANTIMKRDGYCENKEYLFIRKGGEEFSGLFSARLITLMGVPHVLSSTRDITERKKADSVLKRTIEELRKSNIEKDKLFSIIAHDLRNPFTGFIGLTNMMVDELSTMSTDEIHRIASELRSSSANLFALLENLLEWSKVEQGMIRVNPQPTLLFQLVMENISKIEGPAIKKNINITCSIAEEMLVYSDINILNTVLRNLLSNAIKFTHRGGEIKISAKVLDLKNIEISVKDSGIGMSREMVDKLFSLDSQSNRKGTEGEPSTGLGLILCKGFIENQGGTIRVESEEGKGSCFYFTVPSINE